MRIGILSQWFPPESGPASIPGVLARGLVERGHEVTVLTGFPNYPIGQLYGGFKIKPRESSVEYGYRLRRVALFPDHSNRITGRLVNYGSFAATAATLGLSALKDIDVLWVYNSPATVALPMWLAKARFKTPVVLHNMDMWPDSVIHTGFAPQVGGRLALRGLNLWVNAMYRSASVVAYVTPSAGDELERRGVPSEKLRYAPVWIDEEVFKPVDGSRVRRALGYDDNDIVVSYAGALGLAQGVVDLARTVAALPEKSRIRCLLLGSGTQADELAQIANQHPDRVRFLGQVAHEEMTEYSAVPDVSFVGLSPGGQAAFAAPSKVLAIMACGKPILAAASGDTASLVEGALAGTVVKPGDQDALTAALGSIETLGREGLSQMGARALRYSRQELSADTGIDRLESILRIARRR